MFLANHVMKTLIYMKTLKTHSCENISIRMATVSMFYTIRIYIQGKKGKIVESVDLKCML